LPAFIIDGAECRRILGLIGGGSRSAVHGGEPYMVSHPTSLDRDLANAFLEMETGRLLSSGVSSREDLLASVFGVEHAQAYDEERSRLMGNIRAFGEAMSMTNSKDQVMELGAEIEEAERRIYCMEMERNGYLSVSAESMAGVAVDGFLLCRCSYRGFDVPARVWETYSLYENERDLELVELLLSLLRSMRSGIPVAEIRAVARNYEWRKRWLVCKQTGTGAFPGSVSEWTRDQVELCKWSDYYDSLLDLPDFPRGEIIDDDEAVSEWVRERNRTYGQKETAKGPGSTQVQCKQPFKVRPRVK